MTLSKEDLTAIISGKSQLYTGTSEGIDPPTSTAVVAVRSDKVAFVMSGIGPAFEDRKLPMETGEAGLILCEGVADKVSVWLVFDIEEVVVQRDRSVTRGKLFAGSWSRMKRVVDVRERML